jgi:hypothetical protein
MDFFFGILNIVGTVFTVTWIMKPVVFLVANSQSSIHIQKLAVTFLVQKCFALHYRVQTFVLLAPVQSQIKSPTI